MAYRKELAEEASAKLIIGQQLRKFQQLPVMPYNLSQLKEKKMQVSVPCSKPLNELSFNFLFGYRIFPENILTGLTQWNYEDRAMQAGDTIVQQICLPPVQVLSKKTAMGVRVKEIFKEDNLTGFSYETLKGHVEMGISYFLVSRKGNNITFTIHTYSRANNVLVNFLSPVFSSPYQDYCTRKALQQMVKSFEKENEINEQIMPSLL